MAIFTLHFLFMVWHILKNWAALLIPAFYKRIQGKNIQHLRVKGPVIIAMNHPNAFTDPVAFTNITYPLRLKYLARGDAFKPGLVAWLLEQIGIVPIYRMQDGGLDGLKKNDAAYRRVNQLLKKNAKIIVFAEGICVQERRLRPLKKGVARMVFGAYHALPHDNLVVVPVGVNYSKPNHFRSTLFYNVGEPIPVKDFIAHFRENPARANTLFLQTLEPRMRGLITHIRDKRYDEAVYMAETLLKRSLLKARGLSHKNLEQDFDILKEITETVNMAVETRHETVDEFMHTGKAYFKELEQQQLRDWLINPDLNNRVTPKSVLLRQALLVLGWPLHIVGVIGNYGAYRLTKTLTKKILKKNVEFYSSIFIGIGMFLFLLNYLAWFLIFWLFLPNLLWAIIGCLVLAQCGWFSLYYHPFRLKTRGMAKILRNPALATKLAQQRKELMDLLNKF